MTEYWTATSGVLPEFPSLREDLEVDVAIVGAGIVGLTAAELLARGGKSVVVLEARRVGRQATGKSTAKVTSQHGLVYHKLIGDLGEERARAYGAANEAAIRRIADFVEKLPIDCGFERQPAYVYSRTDEGVAAVHAEVEAAARLGLPASSTRDLALPFPVAGAIRFDNQAQFDPVRYLEGLAAGIARHARLFERTRAIGIEAGDPCLVHTQDGATVKAANVIVATQMPTIPDGLFFSKAYPFAHPMVAARIEPARAPSGMFLAAGEPSHSFRTDRRQGRTYLVAAGGTYKPGHDDAARTQAADLERFLAEAFGIDTIDHRWTNEDFAPMDGLPFVGRTGAGSPLLVATGFNAWGMTNGTAAGGILADLLLGYDNPWTDLFDASRLKPVSGGPSFLKENFKVAKHFAEGRLFNKPPGEAALKPGEGVILDQDGERIAVSKDGDGRLHAVSATCTHLGCLVGWNPIDGTWDCPCHGSRFERDGSVLSGPATDPLERRTLATPQDA